jgi:transposase, IS6 family
MMSQGQRPAVFKWRHFAPAIILCAVRWYLRYSLSYRDVQELLVERGLEVDHTTVWRWVQRYAPELEERTRPHLKATGKSWRVDETYVRVKGRWFYLYRAIGSAGATIDFWHFRQFGSARRTIQGYEAMHRIRKGQVRWVKKGDVRAQHRFIDRAFGLAA